jgi:hypothetical protein
MGLWIGVFLDSGVKFHPYFHPCFHPYVDSHFHSYCSKPHASHASHDTHSGDRAIDQSRHL